MPNGKCNQCQLWIDDICHNTENTNNLLELIQTRIKKRFGIIYDIKPEIRHYEIDKTNSCKGMIEYHHFYKNPELINDINLYHILFHKINIDKLKHDILTKIKNENNSIINKNYKNNLISNQKDNKNIITNIDNKNIDISNLISHQKDNKNIITKIDNKNIDISNLISHQKDNRNIITKIDNKTNIDNRDIYYLKIGIHFIIIFFSLLIILYFS